MPFIQLLKLTLFIPFMGMIQSFLFQLSVLFEGEAPSVLRPVSLKNIQPRRARMITGNHFSCTDAETEVSFQSDHLSIVKRAYSYRVTAKYDRHSFKLLEMEKIFFVHKKFEQIHIKGDSVDIYRTNGTVKNMNLCGNPVIIYDCIESLFSLMHETRYNLHRCDIFYDGKVFPAKVRLYKSRRLSDIFNQKYYGFSRFFKTLLYKKKMDGYTVKGACGLTFVSVDIACDPVDSSFLGQRCSISSIPEQGDNFSIPSAQNEKIQNKYQCNDTFPVSTPENEGINSVLLKELSKNIEKQKYNKITSLLIVRNKKLIFEKYYNKADRNDLLPAYSIAKGLTAFMPGIALRQGVINHIDETVGSFFPEQSGRNRCITIRNIISMTSGMSRKKANSVWFEVCKNPLQYLLNVKTPHAPGEVFEYNSRPVVLIGSIIKEKTGIYADQYIREHIFNPLNVYPPLWFYRTEGTPYIDARMNMKSSDLLKIGQLILNKGKWNGLDIVPEEWINEIISLHTDIPNKNGRLKKYGYLWWLLPYDKEKYIIVAFGWAGQFIFIIPEHQMVVVSTAGNIKNSERSIEMLFDFILPAINNKASPPVT